MRFEHDRSDRRHADAHPQRQPARHPKVDVPASKLKMEIARILKRRLHPQLQGGQSTPRDVRKTIRIYLKYTAQSARDLQHRARVAPGLPRVCRPSRSARVLGGLGINILTTPRGVMTGKTPQGGRGRRSALPRLVTTCRELVKNRFPCQGRENHHRRLRSGQGPKGKLTGLPPGVHVEFDRTTARARSPGRQAAHGRCTG